MTSTLVRANIPVEAHALFPFGGNADALQLLQRNHGDRSIFSGHEIEERVWDKACPGHLDGVGSEVAAVASFLT